MKTINMDETFKLDTDEETFGDGTKQHLIHTSHSEGPQMIMRVPSNHGEFIRSVNVGGWPTGSHHRLGSNGPTFEGPHAFISVDPTIVKKFPTPRREEVFVEPGDRLVFMGSEFEVTSQGHYDVSLTLVRA